MSRRGFVTAAGSGVAALWVAACGGGDGQITSPSKTGTVRGQVIDLQGVAQANFGQLILMYPNGQHVGPRLTPDANGRFAFENLPAGDYQVRFNATGQAIIPEPYQHPMKFAVQGGKVTDLVVRIVRGNFGSNQVEIYCGDGFYQLQPDGAENGETIVKLGTIVCWYNVGLNIHSVTGGPWNDSGDLQKTQSYIWVANQTGLFPYFCRYTRPQMQAALRVTA
ncbi:MAG: hypothetical protein IT361_03265 [Gemmatimonadaceae bacterium]|nr:hypothetical protein [Gemmatimonadaceae bacterium]